MIKSFKNIAHCLKSMTPKDALITSGCLGLVIGLLYISFKQNCEFIDVVVKED